VTTIEVACGDWRLKAFITRELDRLELLLKQIKTVEAARNTLLAVGQTLIGHARGIGDKVNVRGSHPGYRVPGAARGRVPASC